MKRFFNVFDPDVFNQTEAACLDMQAAYVSAVKRNIPDALIVIDKFHLI